RRTPGVDVVRSRPGGVDRRHRRPVAHARRRSHRADGLGRDVRSGPRAGWQRGSRRDAPQRGGAARAAPAAGKSVGSELMKPFVLAAIVFCAASGSVAAQRQGRGAAGGADVAEADVSPAEVQRMFDAYALMQAQEQLKISDEQFTQFLTRYKALQDLRRRTLQ